MSMETSEIVRLLNEASQAEKDEKERYRRAIDQIRLDVLALQAECSHPKKHFTLGTPYDPSYYSCDICGKDDV